LRWSRRRPRSPAPWGADSMVPQPRNILGIAAILPIACSALAP
jgi:hypothetical protein